MARPKGPDLDKLNHFQILSRIKNHKRAIKKLEELDLLIKRY
jgi:hypothetical protein